MSLPMKTIKNINANGTMSNLVGLWAMIPCKEGKIQYTVFIYGKADNEHFLVQALSILNGEPNAIRIVHLRDMLGWTFYDNVELLDEELEREGNNKRRRYIFNIEQYLQPNTNKESAK